MRRLLVALAFASTGLFASTTAHAAEQEAATLDLGGQGAVTVYRTRTADGGMKLRFALTDTAKKKKPQSVVLYEGGGDDDGPSDKNFRSVDLQAFELPDGSHSVRVDFEFLAPGEKKHRQVDTFIVSVDDGVHVAMQLTTLRERDRTRRCHEVASTTLSMTKEGRLVAKPLSALESDLDDQDNPIDKQCVGKHPGRPVTYKFDGDKFVQVDPVPAKAPKPEKPSAEANDDD
ncbi:MAG: hypothetical protein ABI321_24705 [Polyangia bacterium]